MPATRGFLMSQCASVGAVGDHVSGGCQSPSLATTSAVVFQIRSRLGRASSLEGRRSGTLPVA